MPTQVVKKRQMAPLKKSKGTPIPIPGVNPLMYLEAVDGVDPEEGSGAALFVEAGVEPDIHQSTSAKKAVMNNRYRQILIKERPKNSPISRNRNLRILISYFLRVFYKFSYYFQKCISLFT